MKAEITEDQFCEYIVAQLKKYAWRLAREGKLSWIDRSYNSNFAVVKTMPLVTRRSPTTTK